MPPFIPLITVGGSTIGISTSTAAIAAGAATAAAVTGGVMQYQQGRAQEKMMSYSAKVAAMEAESARKAGKYEERAERRGARRLKARQLVQFAKGGVVPSTGTPLLVQAETARDYERDISTMRYGYGLREARALSEARLKRAMGRSKGRAGLWRAGTSMMTGTYRAYRALGA